MRDILLAIVAVLLVVVAFYAFQLLVLIIVGYALYLILPYLRQLHTVFRS